MPTFTSFKEIYEKVHTLPHLTGQKKFFIFKLAKILLRDYSYMQGRRKCGLGVGCPCALLRVRGSINGEAAEQLEREETGCIFYRKSIFEEQGLWNNQSWV